MRIAGAACIVRGGIVLAAALLTIACGVDTAGLEIAPPTDDGGGDDGAAATGAGDDAMPPADATAADGGGLAEGDGGVPSPEGAAPDAGAPGLDGSDTDGAGDTCSPHATEDCTNGVDDNCDGLIDCADPQCSEQGFSCAPAIPPGWSPSEYQTAGAGACPTGWQGAAPFVEGPDGGATCACACGAPLENACTKGTLSLSLGAGLLGGCGACVSNLTLASDGACDAIGSNIGGCLTGVGNGSVSALAPATVACSATATLGPITYASTGQTCRLAAPSPGGGCASNGACEPSSGLGAVCIAHPGQVACPAGYPTAHTVYAPGDVADGRSCGACSCTSTPSSCSSPELSLYDDAKCSKNAATIPATGSCSSVSGNPAGSSYFVYSATPTGGDCTGPATVPVTGGLTLTGAVTVCCP